MQAGSGVEIVGDGEKARDTTPGQSYRTVITSASLGNLCFLKCKVHQVSHWMFVGVGADLPLDGQNNFAAANSHGWHTANQLKVCSRDKLTSSPRFQWTNGDWILFKADFQAGKLSLVSTQATAPLTKSLQVPANLQDQYGQHGLCTVLSGPRDNPCNGL